MKALTVALSCLGTASLVWLSYPPLFPLTSLAVQLADGTVSFVKSPVLLDVAATYTTVRNWSAKYYFTLLIPEGAGEPLGAVTIQLRQGRDTIVYLLDKTSAFTGTRNNRQQSLSVTAQLDENNPNLIKVTFDPPVPTGQTVTIELKPRENPIYSGDYLFGVTAFPAAEKPRGMYLGVRRLYFHDQRRLW